MTVLQCLKPPFPIADGREEEELTLKPSSSKLDTCEGQKSFTLDNQAPFQKPAFLNICGLTFKVTLPSRTSKLKLVTFSLFDH